MHSSTADLEVNTGLRELLNIQASAITPTTPWIPAVPKEKLQEAQEEDPIESGERERNSHCGPNGTKLKYNVVEGVAYKRWENDCGNDTRLQLIVPQNQVPRI